MIFELKIFNFWSKLTFPILWVFDFSNFWEDFHFIKTFNFCDFLEFLWFFSNFVNFQFLRILLCVNFWELSIFGRKKKLDPFRVHFFVSVLVHYRSILGHKSWFLAGKFHFFETFYEQKKWKIVFSQLFENSILRKIGDFLKV